MTPELANVNKIVSQFETCNNLNSNYYSNTGDKTININRAFEEILTENDGTYYEQAVDENSNSINNVNRLNEFNSQLKNKILDTIIEKSLQVRDSVTKNNHTSSTINMNYTNNDYDNTLNEDLNNRGHIVKPIRNIDLKTSQHLSPNCIKKRKVGPQLLEDYSKYYSSFESGDCDIRFRKRKSSPEVIKQSCRSFPYETCTDKLLTYSDMPPHLQFNPYIQSGYRPILDAWGCLRSLGYVHNETVNIITHGIPIIYILMTIPQSMPWHLQDQQSHFLIWSHLAGAISPWLGSILYHLFMNCGSSPLVYQRLLQLDMFGIWISQSFGALPMVFASVHCLSSNLRVSIIALYCLCSLWGLQKALMASTPWSRRICFALPFLMRNLLCLLRLSKYGGGAPDSLTPTILQDVMAAIGGSIGATLVPEKWFQKGYLDIIFNSHNVMHVLVVYAVWNMQVGSIRDIVWMEQGQCP